MQLLISGILLLIYGLCLYKILRSLIELVHNHKQQYPRRVYIICFLAVIPITFGLLALLYVTMQTLFSYVNALFFPALGLLSIIFGTALVITQLSSRMAPKGLLKKITFTFFWIFFVLWNVGLWAITTYSRRALRARVHTDDIGYRYEPYYTTRYAGPGTGYMMENLGKSNPEQNPNQSFYSNQMKPPDGME